MRLVLFFLLIAVYQIHGQTLIVKVSSADSKEPLAFANLYFQKAGIGDNTNIEGVAKFPLSKISTIDSLVISYIGYEDKNLFIDPKNISTEIEVLLKPSSVFLSEVVVTYEKPLKAMKVLRQAIKNTNSNYPTEDHLISSLFRETHQENGVFIELNEALLETYYTSYPKKKLDRKIWQTWYYEEEYSFDLEGDLTILPLLQDFNTPLEHQRVIASRNSENLSRHDLKTNFLWDPLLLFALDKIKYQYDFLYPKIWNKYQFKNLGTELINEEPCHVISFSPKSEKRKLKVDLGKKNKAAIYVGRVYISKETFAVTRYECSILTDKNFGFYAGRKPLDFKIVVNYKKLAAKWFLDDIKLIKTVRVGTKADKSAILQTCRKEIFVIDIKTNNVKPIADSLIFKSSRLSSLRHFDKFYDPKHPGFKNIPEKLSLHSEVKKDLEHKTPLSEQFVNYISDKSKKIPPPIAEQKPFTFNYHGQEYIDSLHWMANKENDSEFRTHLKIENKYAKSLLYSERKYQKKLFNTLNNFFPKIGTNDKNVKDGSLYIHEDSLGQDLLRFKVDSINYIEVINLTAFKASKENIFITNWSLNQAGNLIFLSYEKPGILSDFIAIFSVGSNQELDNFPSIYSACWYDDNKIIYSKTDSKGRASELVLRNIKSKAEEIIFVEKDQTFDIEVGRIKDTIVCTIQSKTANEIRIIEKHQPKPILKLLKQRQDGRHYDLNISQKCYLLINDIAKGSWIESSPLDDPSNFEVLAEGNPSDYIEEITLVSNKLVALIYENSIPKLKLFNASKSKWISLKIDLGIGYYSLYAPREHGDNLRFNFSSPKKSSCIYNYDFETQELSLIKQIKLSKKHPVSYISTKRLWAESYDGTKIPISISASRSRIKNHKGLILKVYGAYCANTTPYFSPQDAILMEHGYKIAIAHVRGESILGHHWYEQGRQLNKKNSFQDYLACAEYLIDKKYTDPNFLIAYGNSAGGLIVGQAINEKPELFNTAILDHPYLDVINTMMDASQALTIDEYKEWGDPNEKNVFDYILDYSPFQNITKQKYPNVIINASYLDQRTPVWQAAKHASKLRTSNLAQTEVLLLTDILSGHEGSKTGKEWIKNFAEVYSFLNRNLFKD